METTTTHCGKYCQNSDQAKEDSACNRLMLGAKLYHEAMSTETNEDHTPKP